MSELFKGPYYFCGFTVLKSMPGVLSKEACWVCLYGGYGHFCGGFWELVWNVLTEYKHDKHMVM